MKRILLLATTAFILSACGGGGGGGGNDEQPPVVPTPPVTQAISPTASTSIGGFIAYVRALIGSQADTLEPVALGDFVAPTSETAEPESI